MKHMESNEKGLSGCITGILELLGFFLAIAWPIILILTLVR